MADQTPEAICFIDCTSSCHADDCEHHGHLSAPAPREGFVEKLYRLGIVDRTVTDANVMGVLQRAVRRGHLDIESILRAALENDHA